MYLMLNPVSVADVHRIGDGSPVSFRPRARGSRRLTGRRRTIAALSAVVDQIHVGSISLVVLGNEAIHEDAVEGNLPHRHCEIGTALTQQSQRPRFRVGGNT